MEAADKATEDVPELILIEDQEDDPVETDPNNIVVEDITEEVPKKNHKKNHKKKRA